MFSPAYITLYKSGELSKRVKLAREILSGCILCPRNCRINRNLSQSGFCRSGKDAKVYSTQAHFGEEPPISGRAGSGTIFFANCSLRCIFCQNYPFSQLGEGEIVSIEKLAGMMLDIKNKGCHNINLVSPTHFVPQILGALEIAVDKGLDLPLVYNTNGYESLSTLKLLQGIVDIYLPDLKYSDNRVAEKYSGASNYWEAAKEALREMYKQVGNLKTKQGVAYRGLIVRHLILPKGLSGTKEVLNFLAKEVSSSVHISLMRQYYPAFKAQGFPPLDRPITKEEYLEAKRYFQEAGLRNGWFQGGMGQDDIDRFAGENIL